MDTNNTSGDVATVTPVEQTTTTTSSTTTTTAGDVPTQQQQQTTTTTTTTTTTAPATIASTTASGSGDKISITDSSNSLGSQHITKDIPMPGTAPDAINYTVSKHPNKIAMTRKDHRGTQTYTWTQYKAAIYTYAKSLVASGLSTKSGTNLIGFNSPEWHIAYFATIYAGGIPTGVYTTSSSTQCEYFANHSDAQFIFAEDYAQLNKYLEIRNNLPNIKAVIVMDPDVGKEMPTVADDCPFKVFTWEQFSQVGTNVQDDEIEKRCKELVPSDIATLIYTSGTTSLPKGVILTHTNILWVCYNIGYPIVNPAAPQNERVVSYLPLSHIAEQVVSLYAPIVFGFSVTFALKTALSGTLLDTLKEVRPTIFFGVPRVWEKVQVKIELLMNSSGGLKKKLIGWAKNKGIQGGYNSQKNLKKPRGYGIAKKLVFNKVAKDLGLEQAKLLASAAAPISKDTLEFFLGLGVNIAEAYGMSELSGPQTVGYPKPKMCSVGRTIDGSIIKIAEDGEILIKGPNCFVGYYKNPEATKETIDQDGWVHTGDIGHLDGEGYLFITDRKKELIITAGGENIPPTLLEGYLRQILGVEQAVLIGDRQKYITCLFTVNLDILKKVDLSETPESFEAAANCKCLIEYLHEKVQEINQRLPNVQRIQKFKVLPVEFGESGTDSELTPTKKLKRKNITTKYINYIKDMYGDQYAEGAFVASSSNTAASASSNPNSINVPVAAAVPVAAVVAESKPVVVDEPTSATPVKVEETKVEEIKVEETKIEESTPVKVEETKVEETKVEETKIEEPTPVKVEETTTTTVVETVPVTIVDDSIKKEEEESPKPEESTTTTTTIETVPVTIVDDLNTTTTTVVEVTKEEPKEESKPQEDQEKTTVEEHPPKLSEDLDVAKDAPAVQNEDNKQVPDSTYTTSGNTTSSSSSSTSTSSDSSSSTSSESTSSLSSSSSSKNTSEDESSDSENKRRIKTTRRSRKNNC